MLAYEIVSVCFIVFCLWLSRQARIDCERMRAENERFAKYSEATTEQGTEGSASFTWRVAKGNE